MSENPPGSAPTNPTPREGTEWFEPLYREAQGDPDKVPWAELAPKPLLVEWLDQEGEAGEQRDALVIACGLGDDAEELARRGWRVTAFDLAPTAVEWCRERFPGSPVEYRVADLFELPPEWRESFALVVEIYTFQSLPAEIRPRAIERAAAMVAPGGRMIVVCRHRNAGEPAAGPPWPLTAEELSPLEAAGLERLESTEVMGGGEPQKTRRVRRIYRRPS